MCGMDLYSAPRIPLGSCRSLDVFGVCDLSIKLLEILTSLDPRTCLISGPVFGRCGNTLTRGCVLRDLITGNIGYSRC